MRGLLRFLLYTAIGVGLVWTGSVVYHQFTGPNGVGSSPADRSASAMAIAAAVP